MEQADKMSAAGTGVIGESSDLCIIIHQHHPSSYYDLDAFTSTCAAVSIDVMSPSIQPSIYPLTYFPLSIHPSIHPSGLYFACDRVSQESSTVSRQWLQRLVRGLETALDLSTLVCLQVKSHQTIKDNDRVFLEVGWMHAH